MSRNTMLAAFWSHFQLSNMAAGTTMLVETNT
jgi:hypothetical protein